MPNSFTTIIVGNGLGMAINPTHFTLSSGLQTAWSQLDEDTKKRIKNLITNGDELLTEQQLEKHYEVIQACTLLQRFEANQNNLKWLDENARDFPSRFHDLIQNTAWHFHNYNDELKENFLNLAKYLKNFIIHNHTHLVTLNYDKLIYSNFVNDEEIFRGYHGELVDGFLNAGFHPHHLNREYGHEFGWYLHLHGSPLFYTCYETGQIKKSRLTDSTDQLRTQGLREHIILCSTKLKSMRIAQSDLLFLYWHYFRIALDESEKIILLGYSGNDFHVNKEIEDFMKNKKLSQVRPLKIIEYADPKYSEDERRQFWATQLGLANSYFSNETLIRLPSILDYQFD